MAFYRLFLASWHIKSDQSDNFNRRSKFLDILRVMWPYHERCSVFRVLFGFEFPAIIFRVFVSGGSRIRDRFVIRSSEASAGKSYDRRVNKSGFWLSLPGRYVILKSNRERYSAQRIWHCVNCFVVIKYCRFLWSVNTCIGNNDLSSSRRHCLKHLTIASSSLSYIS